MLFFCQIANIANVCAEKIYNIWGSLKGGKFYDFKNVYLYCFEPIYAIMHP